MLSAARPGLGRAERNIPIVPIFHGRNRGVSLRLAAPLSMTKSPQDPTPLAIRVQQFTILHSPIGENTLYSSSGN